MYHADLFGGLAAKILGFKNIIWNIRTTEISKELSPMTYLLRRLCVYLSHFVPRDIVFVSHAGLKLHTKLGYNLKKSIVIANGYSSDYYQFNLDSRIRIRNSCNLSDDNFLVGFVGRYHPIKGIEDIVLFIVVAGTNVPLRLTN